MISLLITVVLSSSQQRQETEILINRYNFYSLKKSREGFFVFLFVCLFLKNQDKNHKIIMKVIGMSSADRPDRTACWTKEELRQK